MNKNAWTTSCNSFALQGLFETVVWCFKSHLLLGSVLSGVAAPSINGNDFTINALQFTFLFNSIVPQWLQFVTNWHSLRGGLNNDFVNADFIRRGEEVDAASKWRLQLRVTSQGAVAIFRISASIPAFDFVLSIGRSWSRNWASWSDRDFSSCFGRDQSWGGGGVCCRSRAASIHARWRSLIAVLSCQTATDFDALKQAVPYCVLLCYWRSCDGERDVFLNKNYNRKWIRK